jgi:serine/threonine protein kinase
LETPRQDQRPPSDGKAVPDAPRDEDLRVTVVTPSRGAIVPDAPNDAFDSRMTAEIGSSLSGGTSGNIAATPTRLLSARFLESETVDFTKTSVPGAPDKLPEVEGYDVRRRIGQGGMGVVFEGVQQATGRPVAIKFMLDGSMDAAAARKRFEREIDVVAGLQHPGIVSIVDAGVRKGRYFYVMEFVSGKPLDEALKPGSCEIRHALDLVARICDAVDYAHQRGVLHRDLKPSNILIDASGDPHLLDFGLAKRVDGTGTANAAGGVGGAHGRMGVTIAEPGQLVGTVAYMSPEQTLGKAGAVGVRSDVYALGVIAYELVTGQLPVDMEGSIREVLTRIAEKEPARASAIRAGVSRDLDAVLLKALEKSPARRYATAGEFAQDLRLYLTGMPVSARNVGVMGRSWRWVRRNQTLASVIAAAAIILVTVSTWLIAQIIVERDRAKAESVDARESLELLNGGINPGNAEATGEITVVDLMDRTAALLDQNPPTRDITEARVREIIGTAYRNFGEYPKAIASLGRALQIREKHPESKAELADCLHNLAATLWWDGRYDQAEPLYQRALDIRRQIFPGDNQKVAFSLTHLAACRLSQRRILEARDLHQQALDMRRRLLGAEHEEVAGSLNNLAKTYVESEDFDKAEDLFSQALEMIVKLRGERFGGTASTSINLAQCLFERGDYQAARDAAERARVILASLFPRGHHRVASAMVAVARAELALGDTATARSRATDAKAMYEKYARTKHQEYAEALVVLGKSTAAIESPAAAEPFLRQALEVVEAATPSSKLRVASVKADLAELLQKLGKIDEAREQMLASVKLVREEAGEDSKTFAKAQQRLSQLTASAR